jgi:hypothetical protein
MRGFKVQDVWLALLVLIVGLGARPALGQSEAEVKGYNDPVTTANERMAHLPAGLKLTKHQHDRLRALFLQEAIIERRIIWAPGSKLVKRAQIGKVEREFDHDLRHLLTARQYAIFKKRGR